MIVTLAVTFVGFLIATAALSVGVIFGRQGPTGTCGGCRDGCRCFSESVETEVVAGSARPSS